jgi:hypothetical protein
MFNLMQGIATVARGLQRQRGLAGWLYCHNPFYVISAELVFIGLRKSFHTTEGAFQAGALMAALLGYALLLATIAWLIIRYGGVWDDARTILLLVVAMFLAVAVSLDETLARSPRLGQVCYLGGFVFAVAASEALLRGIRLRLPALYRIPYYLILLLFFSYPLALTPYLNDPDGPTLRWLLFGFSPLAGVVFLSLIPAIRRGSQYVAKNGSPWPYPLYPWTLFGLLGVAILGRASYLCTSFHFVGMSRVVARSDSIFGPYFLVPFLLALEVLIIEAAAASRNGAMKRAAMAVLPGILILTVIGHRSDPVYRGFLALFQETLGGTPLFLGLIALIGLYGYAGVRRLPHATGGLAGTLIALSVVGPGTLDLDGLIAPQPLPLVAVAALELGLGIKRRQSWHVLVGAGCLVTAITTGMRHIGLERYQGLAASHLAILVGALIGACWQDGLGRFLQRAAALLLALACVTATWRPPAVVESIPDEWIRVYPVLAISCAAGYAMLTRCRPFFIATCVSVAAWLSALGWKGYRDLRQILIGLDWIVVGLGFFALAVVISLFKMGVPARWRDRDAEIAESPLGKTGV